MATHTEYGSDTKATTVADAFPNQIKDRVVLVTGVSRGGIGGGAVLAFARQSPSLLILVSRTQSKLDEVTADIKAINPAVSVKSVVVDLASQASVRKGAEEIKSSTSRIDLFINNAGMNVRKRAYSPEGIESQLATNHIGPFLLTNLLRDQLLAAAKDSAPGATRIVNVSSAGHRSSPFRFHDYNNEGWPIPADEAGNAHLFPDAIKQPFDGYCGLLAYCHTKTANVLFSAELNKRFAGTGVVSYALHPGTIFTEVLRDMSDIMDEASKFMEQFELKAGIDEGASTTVVAAVDPALNGMFSLGRALGMILTQSPEVKGSSIFLEDCQLVDAEPYAVDPEKAEKLWKLSEELVKQEF